MGLIMKKYIKWKFRDHAQDNNNSLGKIISIDLGTKKYEILSSGHRNVQGLFYDKKNDIIFFTEHGPKGGDEVNYIQQNLNYGWPVSSYGTKYFLEPSDTYNKGDKLLKYYKIDMQN